MAPLPCGPAAPPSPELLLPELCPQQQGFLSDMQGSDHVCCAFGTERLSLYFQLSLRDNDLISLPKEIGELAQLKELHIQGNRLTVLPPELGMYPTPPLGSQFGGLSSANTIMTMTDHTMRMN